MFGLFPLTASSTSRDGVNLKVYMHFPNGPAEIRPLLTETPSSLSETLILLHQHGLQTELRSSTFVSCLLTLHHLIQTGNDRDDSPLDTVGKAHKEVDTGIHARERASLVQDSRAAQGGGIRATGPSFPVKGLHFCIPERPA
jgi:hypothetical protein